MDRACSWRDGIAHWNSPAACSGDAQQPLGFAQNGLTGIRLTHDVRCSRGAMSAIILELARFTDQADFRPGVRETLQPNIAPGEPITADMEK